MMRLVEVRDLHPGDLIDLEGDEYADPDRSRCAFQFEYAEVAEVIVETVDCIAVGIEGVDLFGFPPDHRVPLYTDAFREGR